MSSDDEPRPPEPGAGSTQDPPPPPPDLHETESDFHDDDIPIRPKAKGNKVVNRSYKRPRINWETVLQFVKGDEAIMSEDQMRSEVVNAYTKIMQDSRLVQLPGHVPGPTDVGLWKLKKEHTIDAGRTSVKWLQCPMHYRFACKCQLRLSDGPLYILLERRGDHTPDSHSSEKELSKHLTVKQIQALQTGVRMSPAQSARSLRRNLANFSPEKQIDPLKIRNVRRKVAKFRADLTLEQLAHHNIDDSYGSLVRYAESKWFTTLLAQHNDEQSGFHFDLFQPFVIGRNLDPDADIVYLSFSSIWHLSNFFRTIGTGWLFQVNGDATYKVCRRGVALYSLGVNSVPHINNPVCWAIIPEIESKEVIQGTWRAVQTAAFMMIKQTKLCADPNCMTCRTIHELLVNVEVEDFLKTDNGRASLFKVHSTLSDRSLGWCAFSHEEFGIPPNTCVNHTTGIPAANRSQRKYYKTEEIYDEMYDFMKKIAKLGIEVIVEKAHEAVQRFLINDRDDPAGAKYFHDTWSISSGHGRWSVCHGRYGGFVTNASMECVWKDKTEICPPTARLGTFIGGLVHNIEEKGKEHQAFLIKAGRPNQFISTPTVSAKVWDMIITRHPKTLSLTVAVSKKPEFAKLVQAVADEIYERGAETTPLHIKIARWHLAMFQQREHCTLLDAEEKLNLMNAQLIMPRQEFLFELDPTGSRTLADMRTLVAEEGRKYLRLIHKGNKDHEGMTLAEILALADKFHVITPKPEGWGVVNLGCSCSKCYKHLHCCHSVLFGMILDPLLKVPTSREVVEPSLRKGRSMTRGTAGVKRKRLLAAMAAEKRTAFKKSRTMSIEGPEVSVPCPRPSRQT